MILIKRHKVLSACAVILILTCAVFAFGQQMGYFYFSGTSFYIRYGGTQTVQSGGEITVASGGTETIASGGLLAVADAGGLTVGGVTVAPTALWTGTENVVRILADSTLMSYTSGYIYVARPIAAKTTATLPAEATGRNYTFIVADADTLRVTAAGTDSIITNTGAAFKTITSVAGSFKITGFISGKWIMSQQVGTWTSY